MFVERIPNSEFRFLSLFALKVKNQSPYLFLLKKEFKSQIKRS